jgi:hypothetical protein
VRNSERLNLACVVVALTTVACRPPRTESAFARIVYGFEGAPVQAVVDRWGYPTGSFYAPNGRLVYFWESRTSVQTATVTRSWSVPVGPRETRALAVTTGGDSLQYWCKAFFEVESAQKIVARATYDGNNCTAVDTEVAPIDKNDL